MFAIIVSEKGGAERREEYDRTEINVGRVQGNDLMLPKGNVSKRHARLLYRDGRFIVTDLKSTNGTYVNGRKIAQATIVREGDKIYIGDFVLRIETTPGSLSRLSPDSGPIVDEVSAEGVSSSEQGALDAPSRPSQPSTVEKTLGRATLPRIEAKMEGREIISHFPLEQDPEDSVPGIAMPGPPRVPSGPRMALPSRPSVPPGAQTLPPGPAFRPTPSAGPVAYPTLSSGAPSVMPLSPSGRRGTLPVSERIDRPLSEPVQQRRVAVAMLLERTSAATDLSALASGAPVDPGLAAAIERIIGDRAAAMKASGELFDLDLDAVVADARRELLELGPLQAFLSDEDVSEIQIVRHDYLAALHTKRQVVSDLAFSSEESLGRVVRRLCAGAGHPLAEGETYVERRLAHGVRLFGVLSPASDRGAILVIRKARRSEQSLEDLVRSGTISRAIAGLLGQCVAARANILITGAGGSGTTSLLAALSAAGGADERAIILQEDDEILSNQPLAASILVGDSRDAGSRAVRAAARIRPDRLVVGAFAGAVAAEVIDAISDGAEGVLAAARAPTLRQAVLRITADLAVSRPGLTPEAAREWLASAFDLAIEVARLRDGRHRVMRVAELGVEGPAICVRDIFTFTVERKAAGGALEGSFHPTGVIPRCIEDLAPRGASVDTSIFKRQPGR